MHMVMTFWFWAFFFWLFGPLLKFGSLRFSQIAFLDVISFPSLCLSKLSNWLFWVNYPLSFDRAPWNRRVLCKLMMSLSHQSGSGKTRFPWKWRFRVCQPESLPWISDRSFFGQSFSREHYPPIYQQAGKGFIYFITLRIILKANARRSFHHILWIFSCFSVRNCQRAFYLAVTGSCKTSFLVFRDQLKV